MSGGSARLYIDGVPAAETTELTTGPADMGSGLKCLIGKSFYEEDAGFAGEIDNISVYRQALTAAEIRKVSGSAAVRGDVNADGVCSRADAEMMLHYLLTAGTLTDPQAGDLDGNGRITAADLSALRQILLA